MRATRGRERALALALALSLSGAVGCAGRGAGLGRVHRAQESTRHGAREPARLPQASLLAHVPADAALAVVVRRNALRWLTDLMTSDPELEADLSEFLLAALGVDLTRISGMVWVVFPERETLASALYLYAPNAGSLTGTNLGSHRGVSLFAIGEAQGSEWVGAARGDGFWLGHEQAVKHALDHALDGKPALAMADDRPDVDVLGRLDIAAWSTPTSAAIHRSYGLTEGTLIIDATRKLTLKLKGQDARVERARAAVAVSVGGALSQLRKTATAGGDKRPFETAAGLIAYHHVKGLLNQLQPRLEGTTLVSTYQIAELTQSFVVAGITAAVVVPEVLAYLEHAKTTQARDELARLGRALITYSESTTASPEAGDVAPRVTRIRLVRTPYEVPCGKAVSWDRNDRAVWQHVGFSSREPMHYSLEVGSPEIMGVEAKAGTVLVARAEGDLDCDGVLSTYDLYLGLDAQGRLVVQGEIVATNDGE